MSNHHGENTDQVFYDIEQAVGVRAPAAPVQTEPEVVQAAKCIVAGHYPPEWLWRYRPGLNAQKWDPGVTGTFLRPRVAIAEDPWYPGLLVDEAPSFAQDHLETNETDPINAKEALFQAQAYQMAMEEVIRFLVEATEHGRPRQTNNPRLELRFAAAAHEELSALLAGWRRTQAVLGQAVAER